MCKARYQIQGRTDARSTSISKLHPQSDFTLNSEGQNSAISVTFSYIVNYVMIRMLRLTHNAFKFHSWLVDSAISPHFPLCPVFKLTGLGVAISLHVFTQHVSG